MDFRKLTVKELLDNLTPKSFSVTDKIAATKSLTGRDLKDGEFSFELVEGDKVVATGIVPEVIAKEAEARINKILAS
mgnify:CR=1 FL=1